MCEEENNESQYLLLYECGSVENQISTNTGGQMFEN